MINGPGKYNVKPQSQR